MDPENRYQQQFCSKPGWQRERLANFLQNTEGPPQGYPDLVDDGWTHAMRRSSAARQSEGIGHI